MNQAFHLYRLQQIDTQMDQVISSVAEIDRRLSGDETVKNATQAYQLSEKLLNQEQHSLKKIEFAVKEQQIKISQSESTLYSGKVRNPKELQDLQKEIASLKKHLASLEDQQIEVMVAVEERESQMRETQSALNQVQATFAEKSAGWVGQKDQLLHTLDRLKAERTTATPPVSPESMRLYENIRKRKSGVAVTTVNDGSCTLCGATIRPMELQAARISQELVYCSTCGRILYVG